MMKTISVFSLVFAMLCSSIIAKPVNASTPELKWKNAIDE